jgi:hypothetical protein
VFLYRCLLELPQMKYECSYNADVNTIESVTHGLASFTGLIDMLRSILDLCSKNATADIIVDHSNLDAGPLTMKDLSKIISHIADANDLLKTRKCAHIVAKDLQFGLVRTWEIMVELAGITDFRTMVFRNKTDAIEWIKSSS